MNTSNNNRYKDTENRIKEAFYELLESGKNIDSISVSDICRASGISRPSFYTHYMDINDMMIKIEEEKAEVIKKLLMSDRIPTKESLIKYFEYLKKNKAFYTAYLSSVKFSRVSESMMNYHIKTFFYGVRNEEHIKYVCDFFQAGIKAAALRWLNNNCHESPDEIAGLLQKYFSII